MRVLAFCILFFCSSAFAQQLPPIDTGYHRPHLKYVVSGPKHLPEDAPILIAIHGWGNSGRRFLRLAKRLKLPWRVIAPNAPVLYGSGWSWYKIRKADSSHDVERSTSMLVELIERVQERWPKAPRPFVIGFSQGGVMSMSLAARAPEQIQGAVVIAGYLVPGDLSPQGPVDDTSMLVIHGKRDSVVRFGEGREAAQRFSDNGYNTKFVAHSGGHYLPGKLHGLVRRWLKKRASQHRPIVSQNSPVETFSD